VRTDALLIVENLTKSTSQTLFVTLEWIAFGCVHKLNLEEAYSLYRLKLVTETGLIVRQ